MVEATTYLIAVSHITSALNSPSHLSVHAIVGAGTYAGLTVDRKLQCLPGRRVEYDLTELGRTLRGPLEALSRWAEEHISEVSPPAMSTTSTADPPREALVQVPAFRRARE